MPTFEAGFTTPAAGTNAAYVTLNTASSRRAFVREQGFFTTAATASSIGMNTPANTPTNAAQIAPLPKDSADASSTMTIAVSWSTVPTTPTNAYFRKVTLGAAVGAGVIWKVALDERWILAKSAYWVWWNYGGSTASALDGYIEADE
jgi:hypothetical protein